MVAAYGSASVVGIANNATTFTIPKPSSLAAGERLVVCLVANSGTATYSYTSGGGGSWADASGSPEAAVGSAALTKVADASDVAATNFTFTRTAGTTGAAFAAMIRFTGAGTIADVNATSGSGTSLTLAQVTAANANTLLVHVVAKVTNATGAFGTPPNSATLRTSGTTSGTALVYAIADETVSSGATGTRAWTYTGTSASRGYLLAINPSTTASVSPVNAAHAHSATSPTLTQHQVLAPANASHAHSATSPTLVQHQVLAPDSASHAHAATSPALTQHHVLSVDSAAHDHAATSPTLTQRHVLEPDDATHEHSATSPTVAVGALSITPDDGQHAHTATEPTLTQHHVLTVDDALHEHTATSPAVTIPTPTPAERRSVALAVPRASEASTAARTSAATVANRTSTATASSRTSN